MEGTVQSYSTRRARVVHVGMLVVGWVAFGLLWWRVLERPGSLDGVGGAASLVMFLAIAVGLVTWAWVAHNVALARRRGGRHGVVPLRLPEVDRLGRRLEIEPGAGAAALVVVRVDGPVKHLAAGEGTR